MSELRVKVFWIVIFAITLVMGVPWFLWGSSLCVVGIPVWILYHALWLVFLFFLFWLFVKYYWAEKRQK
ncbi:hypothetical protein IBX65_03110 [Candidatus Aerophobetes bacterium]|nr:hypothetical protein [Candidatus Aerophobetes bacterium]